MQPILQHYFQEFERIHPDINAIGYQERRIALDRFLQLGFPSYRDEKWRYTARSPLLQQPFKVGAEPTASLAHIEGVPSLQVNQTVIRCIFINGKLHLPDVGVLPDGLQLSPISYAMKNHPERLLKEDFRDAMHLGHGLNALNNIFSEEGVMISVADDCVIEPTLELWYVSHPLSSTVIEPRLFCMRNDIRIGKKSTVKIVEHVMTSDGVDPSLCMNTFNTMTLQAGAKAEWAQVVHISDQHTYIGQLAVKQHQNSHFHSQALVLGGGLVRNTLSVDLCEASSVCELRGLSASKRKHQIDHQIVVHHQADRTKSDIHYRGIADDQSRVSFGGEVIAQSGIHQMISHQGNYNLLLSDQAVINTQPRLALFADDIECTHGATVGALDIQALFYLQARGVSEKTARLMLIQAFGEVIYEMMPLLMASPAALFSVFQQFMQPNVSKAHDLS